MLYCVLAWMNEYIVQIISATRLWLISRYSHHTLKKRRKMTAKNGHPCTEWFSSLCLQTNRKHMENQSLICTQKTSFYTDNITSTLTIVVFSINWSWMFALYVGSGSLSSPMREHRNFAQFYCISVTNFSTVSECILLEIIWIKGTFSSHSYGCFYVCMQCTSKNRQLIFYGRYLPFVRCRSRGPRLEWKQSMCLSARWQSDTRSTQQYVVSLDRKLNADSSGVNAVVVYKHLWSLERILVGNSQKNSILNHKTPSNV